MFKQSADISQFMYTEFIYRSNYPEWSLHTDRGYIIYTPQYNREAGGEGVEEKSEDKEGEREREREKITEE